jgi:hypothetical protein
MLKQKYFLADIFILSAEKQPIKLSWRKIVWLLNPAYPKRNPGYLNGVFIHRFNNNGFAGKYWNEKNKNIQEYLKDVY